MKSKLIAMVLFLAIGAHLNTWAQNQEQSTERREQMMKQRAEALAKEMKLDKKQKETFLTLYAEYQKKLNEMRRANRVTPEQDKAKKLTDEEAENRLTARFNAEQKELDIKKEYYNKMKQHFSPVQLYQVFAPAAGARRTSQARPNFNRQGGRGGFGGQDMPNMDF
jgi:ribosomal protein L11 methylase PrmA